jgi:hypothetical protein
MKFFKHSLDPINDHNNWQGFQRALCLLLKDMADFEGLKGTVVSPVGAMPL